MSSDICNPLILRFCSSIVSEISLFLWSSLFSFSVVWVNSFCKQQKNYRTEQKHLLNKGAVLRVIIIVNGRKMSVSLPQLQRYIFSPNFCTVGILNIYNGLFSHNQFFTLHGTRNGSGMGNATGTSQNNGSSSLSRTH